MSDIEDHIAVERLMALYGHIIDGRAWDRLDELFTEDVVFDSSSFGNPVHHGLPALHAAWEVHQHPVAHHATNVLVLAADGASIEVLSKGLGVGPNGRVGSVTYRDVVRRTPAGLRIAHRIATLRR